jgi:hypothetical protein
VSIAKLCICIEFLIIQNTASNFPFDEELYYQNVLNCKTLGFQQKIFSHISTISEQKLISANLWSGVLDNLNGILKVEQTRQATFG